MSWVPPQESQFSTLLQSGASQNTHSAPSTLHPSGASKVGASPFPPPSISKGGSKSIFFQASFSGFCSFLPEKMPEGIALPFQVFHPAHSGYEEFCNSERACIWHVSLCLERIEAQPTVVLLPTPTMCGIDVYI